MGCAVHVELCEVEGECVVVAVAVYACEVKTVHLCVHKIGFVCACVR